MFRRPLGGDRADEPFSRAIHRLGPRASQSFVSVNCGALVDTLLEGALFGHERGAFSMTLPPLRERRADIFALAVHFLEKHRRSGAPPRLSEATAEMLVASDWPGNVRELESAIVRALNVMKGETVEPDDLGLPDVNGWGGVASALAEGPSSYKTQKRRILDVFERQYLAHLMRDHRGNVTRAARAAGKERRDLGKLLKRHGLDPRQFAA